MSPSLESIRQANASRLQSADQPVIAVFTGGTSGIGDYTLRTFARHAAKGAGARIYLVGRSAEAAATVQKDLASLSNVQIHFVQADDLSLIKETDRCSEEVARLIREHSTVPQSPHIDLLFMSHADMWVGPRRETVEGLDKMFSLVSYSRIRFTQNFLPLLAATSLPSSRVISVYAGGVEAKHKNFYPSDLSLRDPKNFRYFAMRNHAILLKMISFEQFAAQHANIAFVHTFPGLVITPAFERNQMPMWFNVVWKILGPLAKTTAIKPTDIGDWILGFTADQYGRDAKTSGKVASSISGAKGGGVYATKFDGTVYDKTALYEELRRDGFKDKAWQHVESAFKAITEQGVFRD